LREARGEYPNGGSESPSLVAVLEVRNLFPLKGSALFFASFFKEKKEGINTPSYWCAHPSRAA